LDQFKTNEGKLGTIFRYFDECYDLAMIHEDPNHRRGIDQKDMVWMLNRALSAVGYAHNNGILHGSIEPSHFVVRTRDHNVLFADWCWSVVEPAKTGDTFRIATPPFSAPEVEEKRAPTPAADIYSLGKCMIYVLGGDAETNFVPESVEDEIYRLLMYMVMESKLQRAQDAWQLHGYLNQLIVKLWGKRTFRHFQMSVDPL
jgi:serine/threonine protein kinase